MIERIGLDAPGARWLLTLTMLTAVALGGPRTLEAQRILTESQQVITVAKGKSALVIHPRPLQRVTVADAEIADPVTVSPQELLVNGKQVGTTSLIVWSDGGQATIYTVEVTADAALIGRQLQFLFPETEINVSASGNNLILSGAVGDATVARRAVEIAGASGATVVNNLSAPTAEQILVKVRFAEVTRNAGFEFGTEFRGLNLHRLESGDQLTDRFVESQSLSDHLVHFFLVGDNIGFEAKIAAMRARGEFRSLAEPNLLALEGQAASFLAGGEFPFPVMQGGNSNSVTIIWKEFGVRLNFVPHVTNTGSIRLAIEPEVSSLDFANGISFGGFRLPTILSRRARTEVELRPGQHLAIAGLLDNSILDNIEKLPILGDIPILGALFRSKEAKQKRTELLVIVTPHIVKPTDTQPPVPTGETETWKWMRGLRDRDLPKPVQPPFEGGTQ